MRAGPSALAGLCRPPPAPLQLPAELPQGVGSDPAALADGLLRPRLVMRPAALHVLFASHPSTSTSACTQTRTHSHPHACTCAHAHAHPCTRAGTLRHTRLQRRASSCRPRFSTSPYPSAGIPMLPHSSGTRCFLCACHRCIQSLRSHVRTHAHTCTHACMCVYTYTRAAPGGWSAYRSHGQLGVDAHDSP